jgi:SpoVK/Ycf46/Vps4 family AAA+-type ATPase
LILSNNLASLVSEKSTWKNVDITTIADITDGFSGSDIQRACVHATKKMLRKRVAIKDQHQHLKPSPSRYDNSRHLSNSR